MPFLNGLALNPPPRPPPQATSALDSETEAAIMSSLNMLARGRTSVFVAHRLSTVKVTQGPEGPASLGSRVPGCKQQATALGGFDV